MLDRPSLAIVIPCYNEAQTIENVIRGCRSEGDVFVIDDGSTDGSGNIASKLGATVIRTSGKTGYDRVIELGLRETYDRGYEFVVTIDADGEHDPLLVSVFRKHLEAGGYGLVAGVRPKPQRFAEFIVCTYCRLRFGISDILCGMKGYSRRLLSDYRSDQSGVLVNTWPALLWVSKRKKFIQVAVTGEPRQDNPRFSSRFKANKMIFGILPQIISLKTCT